MVGYFAAQHAGGACLWLRCFCPYWVDGGPGYLHRDVLKPPAKTQWSTITLGVGNFERGRVLAAQIRSCGRHHIRGLAVTPACMPKQGLAVRLVLLVTGVFRHGESHIGRVLYPRRP